MQDIKSFEDELHGKIKVLNETTWESKAKKAAIDKWMENFQTDQERTHALFLLSNFMYFGSIQIKQLLISLYRDLYKYPIIKKIRQSNQNTVDLEFIKSEFKVAQSKTMFLGMGNASESGNHLLYSFRQENKLSTSLFGSSNDLFTVDASGKKALKHAHVNHYVLFDDFCGSGSQALSYAKNNVSEIRALNPDIQISYLMLFATKIGKETVSVMADFNNVEAVVEFDNSFKFFSLDSRYLQNCSPHINKDFLKELCERYGEPLVRDIGSRAGFTGSHLDAYVDNAKLGWGGCQLLIGFSHNIPDNTLPIIWYNEERVTWYPIFKRHNKTY
ncbi:hypothetical protein [Mucilaginibacter sp. PAMB04168]|uniref:phosphoribosyltransferase-like protein n=1 Tax=Mucilaginibacter sp. PAMB04168 TaxID=3138567 RepID=UPI0031F6B04A